jgi:gliding motility-associated lipoprotein GldD
LFDQPGFPYRFEYPAYATISRDTVFLGQKAENPYWININLPRFNGMINITYRPITPEFSLERLNEEAWGLSFFHHEKAEYINTKDFNNGRGVAGQLYIIGGNTATRYQFTATDSVRNFVRGALYFDVTPNADSLKPANDFLEQDIRHMLLTMQWK